MTQLAKRPDIYLTAFRSLGGDIPTPVSDLRDHGFSRFLALGFPTTTLERWRFTNVSPIASGDFTLGVPTDVKSSAVDPFELQGVTGPQAVFVNGRFVPGLSRAHEIPGVEVRSLADLMRTQLELVTPYLGRIAGFEDQAFTALNTALMQDGAVVLIADDAVIEKPLHLLFLTTAKEKDRKSVV